MKKMNVIVVFDTTLENTLICKRTKEPYMGMYNLVGGKIEKENDGLNEAYRELEEETNIKKKDIDLIHFMNLSYTKWDKELEVYYGILKNEVELIEEVNKLEWVNINDNFFDMNKYAGEGNIGHIIEEIKIELNNKNINLFLSGNSLNGQIRLPFLGGIIKKDGSKKYYDEKYYINNTNIFISNGLGNPKYDIRLLNTPSINFYRLYSK